MILTWLKYTGLAITSVVKVATALISVPSTVPSTLISPSDSKSDKSYSSQTTGRVSFASAPFAITTVTVSGRAGILSKSSTVTFTGFTAVIT